MPAITSSSAPAVSSDSSQAPSASPLTGSSTNHAPSGTDKVVTTTEDSPYTFTAADFGFSDPNDVVVPANGGHAASQVLVLYNVASASGAAIANYYASVHPGVQLLGITGVDPNSEDITADDYLATIRPQVLAALTSSVDFIVTTKGLPLRINVTEPAMPLLSTYVDSSGTTQTIFRWQQYSSLESELADIDRVDRWQMMGDQSYMVPGNSSANGYYLSNSMFSHGTYGTRLTSRLDGYTVADVTASIDRSQNAYVGPGAPSGAPYFLIDNDPTKVYGAGMDNLVNAVLVPAGEPVVYDDTLAFVGSAPGPIIGYDSHGVHQASTPPNYLINGLTAARADGAVFESWESYNAYSFNVTGNPHSNQGQVAQWLQIGGTAGVGNVEEPTASTATVTNEDQMFSMLLNGHTFAEAAWSATRQFSFVNTVVGDPLMVWQTTVSSGGSSLLAVKISTLPTKGTITDNGVAVTAGQFVSVADLDAGLLKYVPAANGNGNGYANFTFQVQDNGGTGGGGIDLDPTPNTITVNVTAVNDAPSGADKTVTTLEDTPYTFVAADFGFSDVTDGNTLAAVKISTLPTKGAITDNGVAVTAGQFISLADLDAGLLKYLPAANGSGTAYTNFAFQVQDNGGTAGGGVDLDPTPDTITVNVTPSTASSSFSLWNTSTIPSIADSGDAQSVELGTKFTSDVNGYITGVRFYKSTANTGAHTASLWSATGQRLATATFTSETANGWQQVSFASPVAITAGATYTVSYHTNVGHYSVSRSYFTSQFASGPLHVPINGGVYRYGTSALPTQVFQASNYWVDVVLDTTPPPDTTPPSVTGFTPASGTSGVATNAVAKVTFSEELDAATVTTSSVFLRDSNNVIVPATVAYDTSVKTVTLTPSGPLANSTNYTIVVLGGTGGVKDLAGNALVGNATSSFTTAAPSGSTFVSLWSTSVIPAIVDSGDAQGVELGTKFTSDVSGFVTGVRFYKSSANSGTHTASLWSASGQRLATATFTAETTNGWQQVSFASPVAITAGTSYTVSYHTNAGHYSVNRSYFASLFASGPLHVPTSGGVYRYGASAFPTQTYQASNYWVDILFRQS